MRPQRRDFGLCVEFTAWILVLEGCGRAQEKACPSYLLLEAMATTLQSHPPQSYLGSRGCENISPHIASVSLQTVPLPLFVELEMNMTFTLTSVCLAAA